MLIAKKWSTAIRAGAKLTVKKASVLWKSHYTDHAMYFTL